MMALYASGYEADISADTWSTFRAQMREQAKEQKGPAVDAVREFYQQHKLKDAGAMLSRYVWFGLVSGPAPKFQPVLRRDELPPEVLELEGFSEILSSYYTEQNIGRCGSRFSRNTTVRLNACTNRFRKSFWFNRTSA